MPQWVCFVRVFFYFCFFFSILMLLEIDLIIACNFNWIVEIYSKIKTFSSLLFSKFICFLFRVSFFSCLQTFTNWIKGTISSFLSLSLSKNYENLTFQNAFSIALFLIHRKTKFTYEHFRNNWLLFVEFFQKIWIPNCVQISIGWLTEDDLIPDFMHATHRRSRKKPPPPPTTTKKRCI